MIRLIKLSDIDVGTSIARLTQNGSLGQKVAIAPKIIFVIIQSRIVQ